MYNRTGNKNSKRHGMTDTPFCRVFYSMRNRCNNGGCSNYSYYGGRGIKCLWNSFEEFYNDMYFEYLLHCSKYGAKDTTIERRDINGDYCKENCRWATKLEQGSNKRNNLVITFKGRSLTSSQWARELKIPRRRIGDRLNAGWSIKDVLFFSKKKNQYA